MIFIADERILRGTPATITKQFLDQDGDAADPGVVTIGITKADGTTLVAAGTATSGTGTSPRTYALAAVATLEWLTATWTSSTHGAQTSRVEVVSGYYFTVAAARTHKTAAMADTTTYPTAAIQAARAEVEQEFERYCWPFVPRFKRTTIAARGNSSCLILDDQCVRSLRSVVELGSDGLAEYTWTAADLAATHVAANGVLTRLSDDTWDLSNHIIEYEYGWDSPPADVLDAIMTRLRYRMNTQRSAIPDRSTSITVDGAGTYGLLVPGRGTSLTAQPEIDVILNDLRYRRPMTGLA